MYTECVLLLQNVSSYHGILNTFFDYRMCSLTIECVLLLQNVSSYHGIRSLTIEYTKCVLLLQNVSPYCRMCSLTIKCHFGLDGDKVWALPRARRALNGRYNLIDETRPNVKYEARLFKYSLRGFAVGVPGMRTCQKRPIYVAKEAC